MDFRMNQSPQVKQELGNPLQMRGGTSGVYLRQLHDIN